MMRKRNQGAVKRGNKRAERRMAISHPPQLNGYQLVHNVTMRFIASSAVEMSITFQNLLDTWINAQTAVAGSDLFRAVKIKKVEVWATPVLGNAVTVAVQFNSINAGLIGD
jgi:hypothetical protein